MSDNSLDKITPNNPQSLLNAQLKASQVESTARIVGTMEVQQTAESHPEQAATVQGEINSGQAKDKVDVAEKDASQGADSELEAHSQQIDNESQKIKADPEQARNEIQAAVRKTREAS